MTDIEAIVIDPDYKFLGREQEELGKAVRAICRTGYTHQGVGSKVMREVCRLVRERAQPEQNDE